MAIMDGIRWGGLLPCCVALAHSAPPGQEGDVIACPHEGADNMILFTAHRWQWYGILSVHPARLT